ncbi:MAG: hypothetical protein EA381_06585 [Planctomycetaceae bacterium]|nr:MAG: hypothetical protein EA381_06585 [Planctomycetaceae bacterium]
MRYFSVSVVMLATCLSAGCGVVRNIEQWKCDNLGMCHFGTTPSGGMGVRPCEDGNCSPPMHYGEPVLSAPQPFSGQMD